ncbi:hypothetical protein Pint_33414 [Pistacia integerrima]|uniref:Uncharacterized protein n=1 Tax=Pistacia integerrima TaxID=434235 RepID=A0ACC0X7T0_9ROSI|nr:hypothetical protein Pint_33414 [Pistacia integerrima]
MGVEKQILTPRTGPKPTAGQKVTVHCTDYDYFLVATPKMVISLKSSGGEDFSSTLLLHLECQII